MKWARSCDLLAMGREVDLISDILRDGSSDYGQSTEARVLQALEDRVDERATPPGPLISGIADTSVAGPGPETTSTLAPAWRSYLTDRRDHLEAMITEGLKLATPSPIPVPDLVAGLLDNAAARLKSFSPPSVDGYPAPPWLVLELEERRRADAEERRRARMIERVGATDPIDPKHQLMQDAINAAAEEERQRIEWSNRFGAVDPVDFHAALRRREAEEEHERNRRRERFINSVGVTDPVDPEAQFRLHLMQELQEEARRRAWYETTVGTMTTYQSPLGDIVFDLRQKSKDTTAEGEAREREEATRRAERYKDDARRWAMEAARRREEQSRLEEAADEARRRQEDQRRAAAERERAARERERRSREAEEKRQEAREAKRRAASYEILAERVVEAVSIRDFITRVSRQTIEMMDWKRVFVRTAGSGTRLSHERGAIDFRSNDVGVAQRHAEAALISRNLGPGYTVGVEELESAPEAQKWVSYYVSGQAGDRHLEPRRETQATHTHVQPRIPTGEDWIDVLRESRTWPAAPPADPPEHPGATVE